MPVTPPRRTRGDEAALAGATLAAVLTLFLSEGAWTWIELPIGAALLAVLAASYELPRGLPWHLTGVLRDGRGRERAEVTAAALVISLCLLLVVAWPLQSVMKAVGALGNCDGVYAAQLSAALGDQAWKNHQLVELTGGRPAQQEAQRALATDAAGDARGRCWGEEAFPWQGWITAAAFVVGFTSLVRTSTRSTARTSPPDRVRPGRPAARRGSGVPPRSR